MRELERSLSKGSTGPRVRRSELPPSATLLELRRLLERHSGHDGIHTTPIPGLSFLRASAPNDQPLHMIHEAALCLIVQGAKQVMLGGQIYAYDALRFLVVSVDVPITAQVMQASAAMPYLCFRLDLDPHEIAAMILQTRMLAAAPREGLAALSLVKTSAELLDAALRLARLLDTPEDIAPLAPLAKQEILYRLLKGEQGMRLRQIAAADSHAQRISRAISRLKQHFDQPLDIEAIAREAHMSRSSFHHHFKSITSMSPLQYQKQLRLQEARRLMLMHAIDAATAGHRVGYESASQFGREYARLFGNAPARDLKRLREQVPSTAA
jgi:AraC-like DNA-binding protein